MFVPDRTDGDVVASATWRQQQHRAASTARHNNIENININNHQRQALVVDGRQRAIVGIRRAIRRGVVAWHQHAAKISANEISAAA
jgi:hypothetical protein